VWVLFSLMIMLGSFGGQKISTKITKQKYVLFIQLLITAVSFLACVIFFNQIGWLILFCGLQESGRGGFDPIKKAYFNKRIPSDKRATIISFDSMIQHLGAFVGLLIGGWIANTVSIRASWAFSGLVLFFISFLCLKLNGDKK
jgi:MFS family permease